jgi:HlyD family secretion protein
MVLTRDVEPGDLVQPGRPLLTLASLGPTRLVMEPDERNLAFLAVGQRAVASTEAFPDRRFDARVAFIAPAVDPDRGTIEVRLEVEGPPNYLRADMTVSIEVEVARSESGLVVPRRAVRESATDTPHILVFENGRAVERSVRVGLEGEERVELLEGADEGERVILDPGVAAGDRVRARREG